MKESIILIEPYLHGHRETYLLYYAKVFSDLGYKLVILTGQDAHLRESINNTAFLHTAEIQVEHLPVPSEKKISVGKFTRQVNIIHQWLVVNSTVRRISRKFHIKPRLVFFMWLDDFVFDLGKYLNWLLFLFPFFIRFNWSGVVFHPNGLQKKWQNILPFFRLNSSQAIGVLDEVTVNCFPEKKKVIVLPDFADASLPDQKSRLRNEIIGLAKGRKIISLVGALQKRKGLLDLLDIALLDKSDQFYYVFCGELFEDTFTVSELNKIKMIQQLKTENCFFYFNRFKVEASLNDVIAASDILYCVYKDFAHSSNLLTKAAAFNKFVLASNRYCMGKRVEEFKLGITANEDDIRDIAHSLKQIPELDKSVCRFSTYLEIHSETTLKKQLAALTS